MLTLEHEALERCLKAVHVWAKSTNYGLPSRGTRFPAIHKCQSLWAFFFARSGSLESNPLNFSPETFIRGPQHSGGWKQKEGWGSHPLACGH